MANSNLGRLLIVDDEIELLNSLAEKLAKQGYETVRFSSPRDALQALQDQQFDLLLTDLMMPEMDGISLLRAVRLIDPYLVGIVMTGQATVQTAVDALKMGALDYILKPFKINVILPALARALEMRRLRLENIQLRETVGIYELCNAISFTLDFQTLLNKIADAAMQQCEAEEASIMLPTENSEELRVSVVRGAERGYLIGESISMEQGIAGWVARHREPVTIAGAVADPRFSSIQPRPDIRAAISMPMLVGGKLVGVVNVNSISRRHPFTMGQVKALSILANTGAAALESAKLHREIRQAEERYRSIFENAKEGILQTSPDGRPQIANPAFARMLAYDSPEDFLAIVRDMGTQVYSRPEDREKISRQLEELGYLQGIETQMYCKDGRKIWISLSARAVRDSHNNTVAYESTIEDITRAKQAERRSATEHGVSRTLAEAATLSVVLPKIIQIICETLDWDWCAAWGIDPDASVLRFEAMWHSRSEAIDAFDLQSRSLSFAPGVGLPGRVWESGRPAWISNVTEDRNFSRAMTAAQAGLNSAFAFPIMAEKQILGVVEFFSKEFREPDHELLATIGTIGHLIGQFLERKQAEEKLKISEQRYRDLVETAPDLIFGVDCDGRFTNLNTALTGILGWPRSDWLGRPFSGMIHPEGQAKAMDVFSRLMQGNRPPMFELRVLSSDGGHVDMELTSTPHIQEGKVTGALGIARNITERKRLEEQYRRAQKLEAFGQLAGGVAHDFNNLLTIINGYSEMLLHKFRTDKATYDFLREIHRAGERAVSLTGQLLAFSRKQVLAPVVLDLNGVVREMEKMLRRLIGEDITLATHMEPSLGSVKADPGQIEQVLLNLAVNARDAMPAGGHLTIETQNVDLDATYTAKYKELDPGPYVMVAVCDTGCGMDNATMAQIFEPFFTTKPVGKGTGLGLATVFGIVKQSEGHIAVYSELGQGTTFKIYLPRVKTDATPKPTSPGQILIPNGSETVMLVEDQEEVRKLAYLSLEGRGYTILTAQNGENAIAISKNHEGPIHLLVTDVVMPGMSGRQLADHLIASRPTLKVLYLSGYTDDAIIRHGVLTKEMAFLQKPFTPISLARKVRDVLDAQTASSTELG